MRTLTIPIALALLCVLWLASPGGYAQKGAKKPPAEPPSRQAILSITSAPEGAKVLVDGVEKGVTPCEIPDINIGEAGTRCVRLQLLLEGWDPIDEKLELKPMRYRLNRAMPPLSLSLTVTTEPPGATVLVNSHERGVTPCRVTGIRPTDDGTVYFKIRLVMDGFEPVEENLKMKGGEQALARTLREKKAPPEKPPEKTPARTPEPAATAMPPSRDPAAADTTPGSIAITTEPSEAFVYLDEKKRGISPLTLGSVTPGAHVVRVQKDGCESCEATVTVTPGAKAQKHIVLAAKRASLTVKSIPPGAEVYLDNELMGVAEAGGLQIPGIRPGRHSLLVIKEGTGKAKGECELAAGEHKTLAFDVGPPSPVAHAPSPTAAVQSATAPHTYTSYPGAAAQTTPAQATAPQSRTTPAAGIAPMGSPPPPSSGGPQPSSAATLPPAPAGMTLLCCNGKGHGEYRNEKDGSVLILVPAGEFTMGSIEYPEEKPVRTVRVEEFFIGRLEVTNGQFDKFVNETGYRAEGDWGKFAVPGRDDHPVVNVTLKDALAYCRWAGLTLPSEAQWERAARGADGRMFPWGNRWNPSLCNNRALPEGSCAATFASIDDRRGTLPVGTFPGGASPCGALDMVGNVGEWCLDNYTAQGRDPAAKGSGLDYRVVRGGGWSDEGAGFLRTSARRKLPSDKSTTSVGFRVVRSAGAGVASSAPDARPSGRR